VVEKHMKKMVKKMLMFTIEGKGRNPMIASNVPSYMHLAEIMNERTQDEKENFGHVNLDKIVN
jgi:hypothetical protein